MMTLSEAIEHAELVANNCEGECAEEHRQLAEWLRELVALRAENEKLRELVADMWHDGMCDCDEQYTCAECCEYHYHERMRELGIEVE